MEFILVIAVIIVLCLVIGIDAIYLLFAGAAIVVIIYVLSLILLIFFFIRMLFAKKKTAYFSRIDSSPHSSFKVAYYMIDGNEYPNVFPEEGFFRSKLYRSDKSCTVLLARNKKFVFDKFSCATCTIGFLLGIVTATAAIIILSNL